MSYILDALRRADSERDRGAVPDVHARQVPMAAGQDEPAHASLPPWAWVGAAVMVLLIGVMAWLLIGREPAREGMALAPAPVAVPAPAPVPVPAPAVAVVPATPALPVAVPTVPAAAPVLPPAPRPAALPLAKPAVRAVAPAATAAAKPEGANEAKAKPSVVEPRTYTLAELPDEVRRELPALAVGGAMYSENAASRMLIINGQLFHERDKLAPGLVLVQIKLKSAVLEFKGYRYGISF